MTRGSQAIERDVVVLVDALGNPIGTAEKSAAHRPPGQLHLAFSVLLYSPEGLLLVQQRASSKYHFPLYWTNACCSHPAPGEELITSAEARVHEELGCLAELELVSSFTYLARCPISGLVEHEFDHVLVGTLSEVPDPRPSEVAQLAWIRPDELSSSSFPAPLTPWFLPALELAESWRAGIT